MGSAWYRYDRVFGQTTSTERVFDEFVSSSVVDHVLDGYNGTVFAYGQTGSGKTHSLIGDENEWGCTPLALQRIFRKINALRDTTDVLVHVSYFEIYKEELKDLFDPSIPKEKLKIAEHKLYGIHVSGATKVLVGSFEEVMAHLLAGEKARHYGVTKMNARSSRSHTILQLIISSRPRGNGTASDAGGGSVLSSTLNMVDLAGSERVKRSGVEGARLVEATKINQSLTVLGMVIRKLSQKKKAVHVPFRDSTLTRVLSSSLGGNARTSVLCCASPASSDAEETKSTLEFASRALLVKNRARINEIKISKNQMEAYKSEIESLRAKLQQAEQDLAAKKMVEAQMFSSESTLSRWRRSSVLLAARVEKMKRASDEHGKVKEELESSKKNFKNA